MNLRDLTMMATAATAIVATMHTARAAEPVTAAFTWQGSLDQQGQPFDGPANLAFRLYDAADGGTAIGSELVADQYPITAGRIAIDLDFGLAVFDGTQRWLEIEVDGTTLTPRQPIMAVPYALHALNTQTTWSGISEMPEDIADGDNDTTYEASDGLALLGTTLALDDGGVTSDKLAFDAESLQMVSGGVLTSVNGGLEYQALDQNGAMTFRRAADGYEGLRLGRGLMGNDMEFLWAGNMVSKLSGDQTGMHWQLWPSSGLDIRDTQDQVLHRFGEDGDVALALNGHVGIGTEPTDAFALDVDGNVQCGSILAGVNNQAEGANGIVLGERGWANHDGSIVLRATADPDSGYFASDREGQIKLAADGGVLIRSESASYPGLHLFDAGDGDLLRADSYEQGTTFRVTQLGGVNMSGALHAGGVVASETGFEFPDGTVQTTADDGSVNWATVTGMRIESANSVPNIIAGAEENLIAAGVEGSTIGGGGGPGLWANEISGSYCTIAGGHINTASGYGASIGGGGSHTALGEYSVVVGGQQNHAIGSRAVVLGGSNCTATGERSFALGQHAKALHPGSMVVRLAADEEWEGSFQSDRPEQFKVAATGGAMFVVDSSVYDYPGLKIFDRGDGDLIYADHFGGPGFFQVTSEGNINIPGTLNQGSDRNTKENIEPIDYAAVLERVADLPVTTWNYIDDPEAQHIGPMAQDFHAAFGLGTSDKSISILDANGVALASIKALHAENTELRDRLAKLEAMIEALAAKP